MEDAEYPDAHLDDPEEWDEATAENVEPQPSGMVVFSLRLPAREFELLRRAARQRGITMSELARTALRLHLAPRAMGSLSTTAAQVTSVTPIWVGGTGERMEMRVQTPPALGPHGNVIPA
ncbi:MAG TPA: hypothetical protein VFD49_22385 [Candidatus Dormibacteraeota bacterium]|nr:hypothetical protein [Candidatus Dormibacteraeota bacterium]